MDMESQRKMTEVTGHDQTKDEEHPSASGHWGHETQDPPNGQRAPHAQPPVFVAMIPAALQHSTDVYGYDQTTDEWETPPAYEGWSQSQGRPGFDGIPAFQSGSSLHGSGQDGRQASSSAAAYPDELRDKGGWESRRQGTGPYLPPPSYPQGPQGRHAPTLNSYERGRVSSPYAAPVVQTVSAAAVTTVVTRQPVDDQLLVVGPSVPSPTYCPLSCFACLCCCWPIGLLAIFFSSEVAKANDLGNYDRARIYSKRALGAAITSILVGIVILVFVIVIKFFVENKPASTGY